LLLTEACLTVWTDATCEWSSIKKLVSNCKSKVKTIQKLRGHSKMVEEVAFFYDGRRIVTASQDETLQIWDLKSGAMLGDSFKGHRDYVYCVAISPDERRIASGGYDNTVIIWDTESKQKVFGPLVKHTGDVNSVCFSPDGKKLASGSNDCSVVLWDTETGVALTTLEGGGWSWSVAFSPDGLKLASGFSKTIRVWRTDNAEILLDIDAHQDFVRSVVWSPDGGQQLVSASDDKTVKFWDAVTGDQIGQPCIGHTDAINSLSISPNGSFIATASEDSTVRLWSVETHQQIGQPLERPATVQCTAISRNGKMLASGGLDREVSLWSIEDILKRQDGQGKDGLDKAQQEYYFGSVSIQSVFFFVAPHSLHSSTGYVRPHSISYQGRRVSRCPWRVRGGMEVHLSNKSRTDRCLSAIFLCEY